MTTISVDHLTIERALMPSDDQSGQGDYELEAAVRVEGRDLRITVYFSTEHGRSTCYDVDDDETGEEITAVALDPELHRYLLDTLEAHVDMMTN